MNKINILITICGRSGSKGARGKNCREFLGKPLIFYTLKCADLFRNEFSERFHTDIAVSSDGKDILNVADRFGDIIKIERPSELSQDDTPKVPVIRHAAKHMEERNGIVYDYVIDLDITSPLRKTGDMLRALEKCMDSEHSYDVIFSAVEARRNPYFNMVEMVGDEAIKVKPSNFVARQQAPAVFDMNASIYCYNRNSLINKLIRSTFEGKGNLVLMDDTYVIDIDHEKDFEVLEVLVKAVYKNQFPELFAE